MTLSLGVLTDVCVDGMSAAFAELTKSIASAAPTVAPVAVAMIADLNRDCQALLSPQFLFCWPVN